MKTIQDLSGEFAKNKVNALTDDLVVDDVAFKFNKSTSYPIRDTLTNNKKKPMVIFSVNKDKANMEKFDKLHEKGDHNSMQDHVIMIWARSGLTIHPAAIKYISSARLSNAMVKEAVIADERIVGSKIDIVLAGFNGNAVIKAKVDTGAVMSSLDANDIDMNKEGRVVTFSFGDKRVTMTLLDKQAIKTADGGVEYRPVVEFDVMLPNADTDKQNRVIKKVQFNLNDRSGMPDKILLGQNFIKAGDFVVMNKGEDQKVIETIDWDMLQEEFKDIVPMIDNNAKILKSIREVMSSDMDHAK